MDVSRYWKLAIPAVLLFAMTTMAAAQTFKVLYKFTGGTDGGVPQERPLVVNGKLYGTAIYGGSAPLTGGAGTVFEIDLRSSDQETTLHTFAVQSDGASPNGGLIADAAGNLYGTATGGGPSGFGTVFKIDSTGALSVLHGFGGSDGSAPEYNLVEDSSGNLYGTTQSGGPNGAGTVFKIDASGTFSTIYGFGPGIKEQPTHPTSGLLLIEGDLYGTVAGAGKRHPGAVFKLNAVTGKMRVIYRFTGGTDGAGPNGGLVEDGAGNLYGVTSNGGNKPGIHGGGVVFALNVATQHLTVLHPFTGKPDGSRPYGGLVRDPQGNLYGTTAQGGLDNSGTAFKIDAAGNLIVLRSFGNRGAAANPSSIALGPTGKLYGTTQAGGGTGCNCGTVFEINP